MKPVPPVDRAERWVVAGLTVAFTALVALWAVLVPLYNAPDELQHMNSAIRLAEGGGWPAPGEAEMQRMVVEAAEQKALPADQRSTFAELSTLYPGAEGLDQMTQHPPAYYVFAAAVLRGIGFLDLRADVALVALRLAGLVFAAPLPFLAWSSVRRLTGSPRAAVVGAASLFAVPQLAFILGTVSNDGAVTLFSSIVIWCGVRIMTGDRRWFTVGAMGGALALALLTKGTALPLVAFAAVVVLLWPRELSLRARLLRAAVAMAAGLLGGWWWVRNLLVYGALQPAGLLYPESPWAEGTGPDVIYFAERMWESISGSFWGNFGRLEYPLTSVITDVVTTVVLAVVVAFGFRRVRGGQRVMVLAALPVLFLVALIVQTWPSYVRSQLPAGLQGRYFFVVILALVAVSAVAWRRMVAPSWRQRIGVGLIGFAAVMAATGVVVEVTAAYVGLPPLLASVPTGARIAVLLAAGTAGLLLLSYAGAIRFVMRDGGAHVRIPPGY